MGQPLLNNNQLNQQQQDMLRLFKNPMPDEDYIQMRRLAVQLLSKQLDNSLDSWENEKGVTTQDYDQLAQQHLRKPTSKN
jgi:hypothetical protein